MPRANPIQTNFTGGEVSPVLYSRVDTQKYQNGAKQVQNAIVVPIGGAKKRTGSKYIWNARGSGARSRLVPFSYNAEENYMLEFSALKIRFFTTNGIVTETAQNITALSKANPGVLTYSGADTYSNGDAVAVVNVGGMTEVNNREFTVANVNAGANTFELSGVNTSSYTTYTSGGTVAKIVEVVTTYSASEVEELRFCQSADTLFISHKDHPLAKLVRTSATSWTLSDVDVLRGPWRTLNTDQDITIKANNESGAVTLEASAALWDALHVGAKYKLYTPTRTNGETEFGTDAGVDAGEYWSYNGNVYYISAASGVGSSAKVAPPTHKSGTVTLYDGGATTDYADCKFVHQGFGIVEIDTVTSSTEVDATVYTGFGYEELPLQLVDPAMTGGAAANDRYSEPTKFWQEGAWSDYRGYPENITFFEQRLFATQVQTVYGSVPGNFADFEEGPLDDQALNYTIASNQVDVIRWLVPGKQLMIGTTSGEYVLAASSLGEAVTPKNIKISRQSSYGSAPCPPVQVGFGTMFMERHGDPDNAGRKMREMAYNFETDSYQSNDMTIFAPHITGTGVEYLAYQAAPDSLIWGSRVDGRVCCLTYERPQEVLAWHRHVLGGYSDASNTHAMVEQVETLPGPNGDELWLKVKRWVDGQTVRYIEVLTHFDDEVALSDGVFVDSALTYSGSSTSTLTGLWHLRGQAVKFLRNGVVGSGTVSATGTLALGTASTKVHVGFGYDMIVETLDFEAGAAMGSAQGRQKRISNVTLRLHRSIGGKVGGYVNNALATDAIDYSDQTDPTAIYTGDRSVAMPTGWDAKTGVYILHSDPTPFMVLAVIPEISVTG